MSAGIATGGQAGYSGTSQESLSAKVLGREFCSVA